MNKEQLQQLTTWTGFVGVMSIIFGIISAIFGLFAFIIGAVPGIITIIMGVKLLSAKNTGQALLNQPEGEDNMAKINELFANLGGYFKIQGVFIIISLILIVISIIFTIAAGMAISHEIMDIILEGQYY